MSRPVTLFTGQWTDLPLEEMARKAASWGYDGLELACRGDHMDVFKASDDLDYCNQQKAILEKHHLRLFAISNHLAGQLVCDCFNDRRSDGFAPPECAGNPERKRAWAVEAMKRTAQAAKNLGLTVVNGFTGSPIWHLFYQFPPVSEAMIEEGYQYFADTWNPILDVFDQLGVRFGLEVHFTEIAFDIFSTRRALEALNYRKTFGFNFDPSHFVWQMVDPVSFLREFPDRIYHVHLKDAILQLNGKTGILCSHLNFGHPDRGWDFRSLGHGSINFEAIIRQLNQIGYDGPLSVEWEDSGMDRELGAKEACEFAKKINFRPSQITFDSVFGPQRPS